MQTPGTTSPSSVSVPPAPRNPSERARQLLFKYQGSQFVILLVGVGFLGIGGVLTAVFDWRLPEDVALSLGGHASTGRVVATEVEQNVTINDRHPMLIEFRYDVDGREHVATSHALDHAVIASAQPDTDVPIEVATLNPSWARIRGTTASYLGLFGLLVLVGPAMGAILIFFAVQSKRREIRAFINGQPITARVVFAGTETRVKMNGRNPFVVRWEFTVEGQSFKGSVSSMERPLIGPLMRQKELTVLYVPDNPRINTVYVD
jgi:hypothetical protein